MFSSNNKISFHQVLKSVYTSYIAIASLFLLYDYPSPLSCLITIVSLYLLSIIYCCLWNIYESKTSKCKSLCIINKTLIFIKSMYMYGLSIILLFFILIYVYTINIHPLSFVLLLFVITLISSKGHTESIFRMGELIFTIGIIWCVLLCIVLSFTSFNISSLSAFLLNIKSTTFIKPFFYITAFMLLPFEISYVGKHYNNPLKNLRKSYIISLSLVYLSVLVLFFLIAGTFGEINLRYTYHPLLALLQTINISENFSGRLNGILCIFLPVSLLYCMIFSMHICRDIINIKQHEKYKLKATFFLSIVPVLISLIFIRNLYSDNQTVINSHSPATREIVEEIKLTRKAYQITNDEEYNYDFSHTNTILITRMYQNNRELLKETLLPFKLDPRFYENILIKDVNNNTICKLYELYLPDDMD